jgi:hypothetical protein
MPSVVTTPTTARVLLTLIEPFGVAVEGADLVFAADLPTNLEPALTVLHTGVRAVLTGRRWYGCDGDTGRVIELNPATPVPPGITLLSVEGDQRWDRIHPAAWLDCPELFVARGRFDAPAKE